MSIRRPLAALITTAALASGGALTACGDPTDSTTGTPRDTAMNTSGGDPGGVSQGNVPQHDSSNLSGNGSRGHDSGND